MVFFKAVPRCKLLITGISLQTFTRPYSNKNVVKIGDKCYMPNPCTKPGLGKDGSDKDGSDKDDPDKDGGIGKVSSSGKDASPYKLAKTRPVRLVFPGKVRMGIIPEEWFDFFYPKTGVTGPYIFIVAIATYLVSKEKYVLEHEYYTLLSGVLLCVMATKGIGPMIAKSVDKEIDEYERQWKQLSIDQRALWEDMIRHEERLQISCEGQMLLLVAKRENIKLQLEIAYRERLLYAHNEVKNRLDYQVAIEHIQRKLMHKNLIDWVVREVIKTYQTEKREQDIDTCIQELASIAAKESKQLI